MGSPSSELPEFFKVYLPDYSRKRLKIPTAFINHFNGHVPEKSIIRDFIGRVWHVEVGQIQNEVYFLKGWQRFLTDNSVEEGDFFVFRYDGYHTFNVMLFGRSTCQKRDLDKKDFCVKEEQDVEEAEREEEEEGNKEEEEKEEEEEDDEDDEDEDDEDEEEEDSTEEEESPDEEEPQPVSSKMKVNELKHKYSGRGRPRAGKRNCLFLLDKEDFCVKEERDVEEAEREEENKEEEEEEKEEEVDDEEEDEDKDEEEDEEEEDSTEEEEESSDEEDEEPQPQSSNKKVIELKHKYPGRGRPRTGDYKRTDVKNTGVEYIGTSHSKSKSKNPSCNLAEVEDSFAMESIFETRNPYFTTRLRKGRRSRLYIPADVLKDYNTALPKKVFFRDPLERTWPGNVSLWKDGRTWITGWKAFCKWNHVRENDTLICELVQEGGHQTDLIVVHIHRAQPSAKGWIPNQGCKWKGERK